MFPCRKIFEDSSQPFAQAVLLWKNLLAQGTVQYQMNPCTSVVRVHTAIGYGWQELPYMQVLKLELDFK